MVLTSTGSILSEFPAAKTVLLKLLNEVIPDCRRCDLAAGRFDRPVLGSFDPAAKVLWVGEGPGAYEERTLIPFVGSEELMRSRCIRRCQDPGHCLPLFGRTNLRESCILGSEEHARHPKLSERIEYIKANASGTKLRTAGQVLNRALKESGFRRPGWKSDGIPISITNIVRCRSTKDGKDAPPEMEPRKRCWAWTSALLEILEPEVIIASGSTAARSFLCDDQLSVTQASYQFYDTPFGLVYVVPHPASALYARKEDEYVEKVGAGLVEIAQRLGSG